MKRIAIFAVTAACVLMCAVGLFGCAHKSEVPDKVVSAVGDATSTPVQTDATAAAVASTSNGKSTVAFLCDSGTVTSSDFNKQLWQGVQSFAKSASSYTAKSYDMTGAGDEAAHTALINTAISDGAKVLVLPGSTYAGLVSAVAAQHSDVMFLLMSAAPDGTLPSNVHAVTYDEFQAGYLAGYALVAEGYRGLGFAGGANVDSVRSYGSGFIQGADAAAIAQGVADDTYMAYWYTGTFTASDTVRSEVSRWYGNGVDVVFSCGGGISTNVIDAATQASKSCVLADIDGSTLSSTVVCSATLNLADSTQSALKALADNGGTWGSGYAGTVARQDLSNGGIALTCGSTWKMTHFTQDAYNKLVASIKSGDVKINESLNTTLETAIQVDVK